MDRENTSKSTLQTYGTQVYPLVTEYVYNDAYSDSNSFESSSDSVFFALLPGVLIHYSVGVSWVFIVITGLFAVLVVILAAKQKLINLINLFKSLFVWLAFLLAAAIVGYFAIWLPCKVTSTAFHLTFMPYIPLDRVFLGLSAIVITAAAICAVGLQRKWKCNHSDILSGGLFFNMIFLFLFAFVLHGGTYLFLWPILLTAVYLACEVFLTGSKNWHRVVKHTIRALLIIFIVLMYFLLIYSLFLALTLGALAVMMLLMSIPLSILAPLMLHKVQKTVL